jgi:hypothetical protein
MTSRMPSVGYLAFPFRIGAAGAEEAERVAHVRQQIEQTLFTAPGERVFRPEFGAGVKRLVFEPNSAALAAAVESNLRASLQVALQGEVDPATLEIAARQDPDAPERLVIEIAYALSAIDRQERHVFRAEAGA